MPDESIQFRPQEQLLTFEEIVRFVEVATRMGVDRVRLTGGEPLVRKDLPDLIAMLAALPLLRDVALTTNGMLLAPLAKALHDAGLTRLNISLDSLDRDDFLAMARRDGLAATIAGVDAALSAGFKRIRINAIAIRGFTERQIPALVDFAHHNDVELRFIEFMPLDAEEGWTENDVLSCREIRRLIESQYGPLTAEPRNDPSQPAVDFRLESGARIGLIAPVTEPFCGNCNRLRLTAEGQIRNCLFSRVEWDVKKLMRSGGTENDLEQLIRECVFSKAAGHGIEQDDFQRPQRAMYQIGG